MQVFCDPLQNRESASVDGMRIAIGHFIKDNFILMRAIVDKISYSWPATQ